MSVHQPWVPGIDEHTHALNNYLLSTNLCYVLLYTEVPAGNKVLPLLNPHLSGRETKIKDK